MRLWIFPLLLAFSSCGTLQKMAVRSSSPMFRDSSNKLVRESNWEFFKDSAPGNLKFLEILSLQDPDNTVLLSVLVKGYAGYAFGVHETMALEDALLDKEVSPAKKQAIFFYTRAFDYGLDYLNKKNLTRQDLLSLDETELKKKMDDKLDKDDVSAVLYTAQAWGSLISQQKENIVLVSQINKVKILFDWLCKKDPDIDFGTCDVFFAQYDAIRPRMAGGSPERAEVLYRAVIKKYPHNLLNRVALIQFVYLPGFEKEKYENEAKVLKEEFSKWEDVNRDQLENTSIYKDHQEYNLLNAIAKKRFDMIETNKTKIFEE